MQGRVQDDVSKMKIRLQHSQTSKEEEESRPKKKSLGHEPGNVNANIRALIFTQQVGTWLFSLRTAEDKQLIVYHLPEKEGKKKKSKRIYLDPEEVVILHNKVPAQVSS